MTRAIVIVELTWREAEERFARRVDRRRRYATDGTQLLELARWTQTCSGCATDETDAGGNWCEVGSGCHECGYTGKRRHSVWSPFIAALLAFLICSCGAPVDHGPIVLSPSDETRELVEQAAPLWTAATGIPVLIGEGGIPVSTAEQVVDMHGVSVCGFTEVTRMKHSQEFVRIDRVVIATRPPPGCPGWQTGYTVLHELGHVVCNHGVDELTANDCHSAEGLMAEHANDTDTIDSASLEVVCSYAPCAWIEPLENASAPTAPDERNHEHH